jgi:hypothetical protein
MPGKFLIITRKNSSGLADLNFCKGNLAYTVCQYLKNAKVKELRPVRDAEIFRKHVRKCRGIPFSGHYQSLLFVSGVNGHEYVIFVMTSLLVKEAYFKCQVPISLD